MTLIGLCFFGLSSRSQGCAFYWCAGFAILMDKRFLDLEKSWEALLNILLDFLKYCMYLFFCNIFYCSIFSVVWKHLVTQFWCHLYIDMLHKMSERCLFIDYVFFLTTDLGNKYPWLSTKRLWHWCHYHVKTIMTSMKPVCSVVILVWMYMSKCFHRI